MCVCVCAGIQIVQIFLGFTIGGKHASLQGCTAFEQFLQCIRHQHQTCMGFFCFTSSFLEQTSSVWRTERKISLPSLLPTVFRTVIMQCSLVPQLPLVFFMCTRISVRECLVTFLRHLPWGEFCLDNWFPPSYCVLLPWSGNEHWHLRHRMPGSCFWVHQLWPHCKEVHEHPVLFKKRIRFEGTV